MEFVCCNIWFNNNKNIKQVVIVIVPITIDFLTLLPTILFYKTMENSFRNDIIFIGTTKSQNNYLISISMYLSINSSFNFLDRWYNWYNFHAIKEVTPVINTVMETILFRYVEIILYQFIAVTV